MAVTLRFGHVADYAALEQSGKLILAGLFEIVYAPTPDAQVIPIGFTLAASLQCSIADGLEHDVAIRFLDGEEEQVGNETSVGRVTFSPTGPGRPYESKFLLRYAAIQVSGVDDYYFVIVVDGQEVGRIPLYVQLAPSVS